MEPMVLGGEKKRFLLSFSTEWQAYPKQKRRKKGEEEKQLVELLINEWGKEEGEKE